MPPIVEETQLEGQPRMTKKTTLRSFAPLVLAILAIVLGTAPTLNCETLQFVQATTAQDGSTESLVLLAGPLMYRTRGDWPADSSFSSSSSCRNYGDLGDYETDAITKTVVAFSVLAPLLGAALILKAFFAATCGASVPGFGGKASGSGGKTCLGISFLVAGILQGLTLLAPFSSICKDNPSLQYLETTNPDLASTFPTTTTTTPQDDGDDEPSYTCELVAGFFLQVVAVVLWLLAGVVTLSSPEPLVIHEHPNQEQTVTYTQKPDGTIEEVRVAIVKGSPVVQNTNDLS